MKTYLVTGRAGFIGSNFVYYLLNKYDDIKIINVDKLTYAGNLENLKQIEEDAVSYTHLDVYKRQHITDMAALLSNQRYR